MSDFSCEKNKDVIIYIQIYHKKIKRLILLQFSQLLTF